MVQIIPNNLLTHGRMIGFVLREGRHEAAFAIATEELLAQSLPTNEQIAKDTPKLDVEIGDLLVAYKVDGEQKRVFVKFTDLFGDKQDVARQFVIPRPGADDDMPFLGSHMLKAREALFMATAGADADPQHRRLLGALQASFERILDERDAFPDSAVKDAWNASIIDTFGNVELPVSPDAFLRKIEADNIRVAIGKLERDNPDALSSDPSGVEEILTAAGVGGGILRGATVRAPGGQRLRDADLVRMVQSNDRLCREIFGAVTKTEISNLSVRFISLDEHRALVDHFERTDTTLKGEWVDEVRQRMAAITSGAGMRQYTFEAVLGSDGGRDVLLITDNSSASMNYEGGRGTAYLYSWPTVDRQPAMEVNRGQVATFGINEVPDEAEIERLQTVLSGLQDRYHDHDEGGDFDIDEGDDFDLDDNDDNDIGALPEPRPY